MVARTLKRAFYFVVATAGVGFAVAALLLLTQTVEKSDDFDRLQDIIVAINIVGGLLLVALLIGNLTRLARDYRDNVPGAKLKARMVGMFVGLAVLPLLVVFYFSTQFINRGIDSWFNIEVEEGLDNALELSRAALELQKRRNLEATQAIARQLEQAEKRFEVGLIAITDVQEAQAAYDNTVAAVIAAKRDLATAAEFLREITGESYAELQQLFAEWRAFEQPPLLEGAPDYRPATVARRHRALAAWQQRLRAIDIADWPVIMATSILAMIPAADSGGGQIICRLVTRRLRSRSSRLSGSPGAVGGISFQELALARPRLLAKDHRFDDPEVGGLSEPRAIGLVLGGEEESARVVGRDLPAVDGQTLTDGTEAYQFPPLAWGGIILGFAAVIGLYFKPRWAKFLGPVYALGYGFAETTLGERTQMWPVTAVGPELVADPPALRDRGGFETDRAAWEAVLGDPDRVIADVVDAFVVARRHHLFDRAASWRCEAGSRECGARRRRARLFVPRAGGGRRRPDGRHDRGDRTGGCALRRPGGAIAGERHPAGRQRQGRRQRPVRPLSGRVHVRR